MKNIDPFARMPTLFPTGVSVQKQYVDEHNKMKGKDRLITALYLSILYAGDAVHYAGRTISSTIQTPFSALFFFTALIAPNESMLQKLADEGLGRTDGIFTLITNVFKVIVCASTVFLILPVDWLKRDAVINFYNYCHNVPTVSLSSDEGVSDKRSFFGSEEEVHQDYAIPHKAERLSLLVGQSPQVKKQLMDMVKQFNNPERAKKLKMAGAPSAILYGPPGNGKTHLISSVATELRMTNPGKKIKFCNFVLSQFLSKWYGETPRQISELKDELLRLCRDKKNAVIVCIDELDMVSTNRDNDFVQDHSRNLLNVIMQLVEEVKKAGGMVFAATNQLGKLDAALKRTGRFDRLIEIPAPSQEHLKKMFIHFLNQIPQEFLSPEILPLEEKLENLSLVEGMSISDVKEIVERLKLPLLDEGTKVTLGLINEAIAGMGEERLKKNDKKGSSVPRSGIVPPDFSQFLSLLKGLLEPEPTEARISEIVGTGS